MGLQCQGSHSARVKLARRRRKDGTASRGALTAPQLEPKSVATDYITYVKSRTGEGGGSGNSVTSLVQHLHRAGCYIIMDVLYPSANSADILAQHFNSQWAGYLGITESLLLFGGLDQ